MILAGDIGGTKTILAVFSRETGLNKPVSGKIFPSSSFSSLDDIVNAFVQEFDFPIETASFGVAGPVLDGSANLPNLPWRIDGNELKRRFGFSAVHLINDLEAIANAIPVLEDNDLHTLNRGTFHPEHNIAVVAPGTGLGEAFLTWSGERYLTHSSEGGHADFAPANEIQSELLCRRTLDIFVEILAAEAGNMALKTMALGGVYLAGGIPPRIVSSLDEPGFMLCFSRKGRLSELLRDAPVHVILNPRSALLGAAAFGLAKQS